METSQIYQNRIQDVIDTISFKEPKHVPIGSSVLTYGIAYAKKNLDYLLDHLEELPEAMMSFLDVVPQDCGGLGLSTNIRAIQRVGSTAFLLSPDGASFQHKANCPMEMDEYDQLIKNPMDFMVNVLSKRKFPEFNKSEEEVYQTLIDIAHIFEKFNAANMANAIYAKEKYGFATIFGGPRIYPPADVIFDRLRGFTGLLTDIRRQKDNILKACESMYSIYQVNTARIKGRLRLYISTFHLPTYLGLENFKELIWPHTKQMVMDIYNSGGMSLLGAEGTWKQFFDFMKDELPRGSIVLGLDDDDPIEAKKQIGSQFSIFGGTDATLIKYGTRQQCIDETKKIIDECAPGGGFIFCINNIHQL